MIVVNATFETTAAAIEAMKPAILAMQTASRAEKGCEDYTFSVELENPNVMRITERWESMAILQAHFQTPHMAAFRAAMAANPPKGVVAHFYEAKEVAMPT